MTGTRTKEQDLPGPRFASVLHGMILLTKLRSANIPVFDNIEASYVNQYDIPRSPCDQGPCLVDELDSRVQILPWNERAVAVLISR